MTKASEAVEKYELHPKVGMSVLAGALANVLIGALAQTGVVDLTGYQAELIVIISGVVGYLVPSA